ncbi:hypothetical protein AB0I28_20605 [Phytomonospora sp. NPDC050363]|uniref:hypothetical protein n=1 Tax=Phytomonospora sp. NPDC050363 TaxID=3155642 RepID=UPI0033FAB649
MTDEFSGRVDRELAAIRPPAAFTAAELAARGRRRMWRRRSAGMVACLLALVMGAVFVVKAPLWLGLPVGGGDAASPSTSPSTIMPAPRPDELNGGQPEIVLEVPPEGADLRWIPYSGPSVTAQTAMLTQGWWDLLGSVEGIELSRPTTDGGYEPVDWWTFPPVERRTQELGEASSGGLSPLGSRPIYKQQLGVRFEGVARPDDVFLTYYPRGSFTQGGRSVVDDPLSPHWRYLAPGCGEASGDLAELNVCEEYVAGNGARVFEVLAVTGEPGPAREEVRTSVVYTPDGNAIVISDWSPDSHDENGELVVEHPAAGFTAEQLTSLALALPPVIIV